MELTPQAVSDAEFREAKRGGYNIRDVDDFLDQIAVGIGQLHERLRDAHHRAEAAEANLADAQRQMQGASPAAPQDAAAGAFGAPGAAMPAVAGAPGGGETDETLRRTLMLAQRTADATIAEAKEEAGRLVDEARSESRRIRAAAEAEGLGDIAVARENAERQVAQLRAQRAELEGDISKLEDHIQAQRENLRAGLDELQELLEDRESLQLEPKPQLSDPAEEPEPLPRASRASEPQPMAEPPPMFPVPGPDEPSHTAGNGFVPGSRLSGDSLSPFGRGRPGGALDEPPRVNASVPVPEANPFAPPASSSDDIRGGAAPADADHFGAEPARPPLPARGPARDNPPLPNRGPEPFPGRGPEPLPAFELPPERDPFAAPQLGAPAGAEPLPAGNPLGAPPAPPLPQREQRGDVNGNVADLQELSGLSPFGMSDGGGGPRGPSGDGDSDEGAQGIFPPSLGPPPGATGFLPDLPQPPAPGQASGGGHENGTEAMASSMPDGPAFPAPPSDGDLPLSIDAPPPPPLPPLDSGNNRPSAWGRGGFEEEPDEEDTGIRFGRK